MRFEVPPAALGDMAVGSGATASFASVPALSGTLSIASADAAFLVDGLAASMAWDLLATADEITGPGNAAKWEAAGRRFFKIVDDGVTKKLYGCRGGGFTLMFR